MTVTDWIFLAVAAVTLFSAYRVVVTHKIMHAALWLGLTFIGVAGIFLLLGADFLAAAQVLVYVGAITTIIIFGIMLSPVQELRGPSDGGVRRRFASRMASIRRGVLPPITAIGFAVLMVILVHRGEWPAVGAAVVSDTPRLLGEALFTRFVIPFEVASVLLLVALVGAIALALKEEGEQ